MEFALVCLLLVTLLLGICEASYAFFTQGTLAGAAREAARTYAITQSASAAKQAAVDAGRTAGLVAGEVSIPPGACLDTTLPSRTVTVMISHTYDGITGFFGATWTMRAEGTMRCDG